MLREAAGISARELDRLASLGQGHSRLIEIGVRPNVEAETARKLAVALGVSLDWLIGGVGDPPTVTRIRRAVDAARDAAA